MHNAAFFFEDDMNLDNLGSSDNLSNKNPNNFAKGI